MGSVAFDCADPGVLGFFWAALLGGEVAYSSDDFVAVRTDRLWLAATRVADYEPPSWPDGGLPKQVHLDLAIEDLGEAEAEALKLGAVRSATQPAPDRYLVMLDPAGHPFCLSTQIPELDS